MPDGIQYSESEYEIQSEYLNFDISVLELYRNDSRYELIETKIGGSIDIKETYYLEGMKDEEEFIAGFTFGFSYDVYQKQSAVAVSPRNFSSLSPIHQDIWNTKKLEGMYRVNRKYTQMAIEGDWGE